ncbi:MAG: CDP-alcohol phosphatidyltransferase family protein [Candidatus Altiarchaeota archaeon]
MLRSHFSEKAAGWNVRVGMIFAGLGIPPNMWTLLSLIPALTGFAFLYYKMLLHAVAFFIISAFIDIIDGNVARVTKSVSSLGAFLDGLIDRYVEIILYVGLWFYLLGAPEVLLPNSLWIILLVFSALMPSFVTAYADHRKVVTEPEQHKEMGGIVERFERLVIIYAGMFLGYYSVLYLIYAIILLVVLCNITIIQRINYVLKKSE